MSPRPDRLTIYLTLALLGAAIVSITGPAAGLLMLVQVVVVVEAINRLGAPGDLGDESGRISRTGD